MNHIGRCGFVLVAGGLGERLGSKKIKISLVCEIISGMTFIDYYLSIFREFHRRTKKKVEFFIMTSNDTHSKTVDFLSERKLDDFIKLHIKKQDKVPCFKNLNCDLDFDPNKAEIKCKPHGHGDIHHLIKESGLVDKWRNELGLDYVYFF